MRADPSPSLFSDELDAGSAKCPLGPEFGIRLDVEVGDDMCFVFCLSLFLSVFLPFFLSVFLFAIYLLSFYFSISVSLALRPFLLLIFHFLPVFGPDSLFFISFLVFPCLSLITSAVFPYSSFFSILPSAFSNLFPLSCPSLLFSIPVHSAVYPDYWKQLLSSQLSTRSSLSPSTLV